MKRTQRKRTKRQWVAVLAVLAVFVGCSQTTYDDSENVIEAKALVNQVGNQSVVVIDARSAADYAKGHLKGAINLQPSELCQEQPVKAMLADANQVAQVLSDKGISQTDELYVYDNNGVSAARVVWSLKRYGQPTIKVINGGQKAIETSFSRDDFTVDVPERDRTDYQAQLMDNPKIIDFVTLKKIVDNPKSKVKLIDTRSQAEYDEGSIPGAIFYPHSKNYYKDGSFKSASTIYLDYHDLGFNRSDEIVLYCKSSYRATVTALLLEDAGFENVWVYDGAWLEWSTKGGSVEKKGPKTPINQTDAS